MGTKKEPLKAGLLCCLGMLVLLLSAHGLADTVLEISDNILWVQGYRIELANQSKPVKLKTWEDSVVVVAQSQQGTVELILDGDVTIADAARQYVSDYRYEPEPTAGPTYHPSTRACRHCGAEPEDHTCPRCHKPFCQHDDFACSYRLNPVPTPWVLYNADGKAVTSGITENGQYIVGFSSLGKEDKSHDWQPGKDYEKANATPSPSPDPFAKDAGQ